VTAVAVVGLGAMGSRIAARLVAAGHEVIVWNRSAEKAERLAELGAIPAATPAQAASRAEVLITMVADAAALRAVTEGSDGVVAGASASLTVVEMSTVGPGAVARLASALPPATGLLDAPVLGSLAEAESGSLLIFAGGPAQLVEHVLPVLATAGSVLHVGDLGAGAAAKLMANAALFPTLGTLGEAIALARGLGLSSEAAYQVLAVTPLAAQAVRRRAAIEGGEYPPRFRLTLAGKDARLIADTAAAAGVDLRVTTAAGSWLAEAEQAGLGDRDYTAILKTILRGRDDRPSRPRPDAPPAPAMEPAGYDGLIIDLDGVVWRGSEPIPGAAEAIAAVRGSGTQAVGKFPIDVGRLGVDLLSVVGHKMYAPKGIGALYVRSGVLLEPLVPGGGQERGLRAGTENVALAVGLGAAADLAYYELADGGPKRLQELRDLLYRRLNDHLPGRVRLRRRGRPPRLARLAQRPPTTRWCSLVMPVPASAGARRPAAAALLVELSLLRQRAGRGHRPGGGRRAAAGVAGQPRGPLRSARRGAVGRGHRPAGLDGDRGTHARLDIGGEAGRLRRDGGDPGRLRVLAGPPGRPDARRAAVRDGLRGRLTC
jgi:3-hydroxyisobutyrate dehydrogenase-like beta-hydroxyacid dehydrogenase